MKRLTVKDPAGMPIGAVFPSQWRSQCFYALLYVKPPHPESVGGGRGLGHFRNLRNAKAALRKAHSARAGSKEPRWSEAAKIMLRVAAGREAIERGARRG